jgi:hypothetical protein
MDETLQRAESAIQGHEERDIRLRPLIIAGIGLMLLAGLTLLGMWLLFDYFAASRARLDAPPTSLREARELPPEPRLQVSPRAEMREMLAAEMAILHSYGWVDREAGIVRIPIERAIEILAARGLRHDGASAIGPQNTEPKTGDRGAMPSSRGSR